MMEGNKGTLDFSCTTVWLSNGQKVVVGRNLDIGDVDPLPGRVLVNKRGVEKVAFPIDLDGPESLRWRSRFGSVTFTFTAKDWTDGGMNEAGLVIEEMSLSKTQHGPRKEITRLQQSQWIQYQLDCASSVDEVVGSLDRIEPMGMWHFFVGDKTGRRAIIEYLDGEAKIHTSSHHMVRALTNKTYEELMAALAEYRAGERELADSDLHIVRALTIRTYEKLMAVLAECRAGERTLVDSEEANSEEARLQGTAKGKFLDSFVRFIRAVEMSEAADQLPSDALIDHAFQTLQALSHRGTRRTIVWDTEQLMVHYRSNVSPAIRFLRFSDLDFSHGRALSVDINLKADGDMSESLKVHTFEDDVPALDSLEFYSREEAQEPIAGVQFASSGSRETTGSYLARLREYVKSAS